MPGPPLGVVTDLAEFSRLGTATVKANLAFRRHFSAKHDEGKPFQVLTAGLYCDKDKNP